MPKRSRLKLEVGGNGRDGVIWPAIDATASRKTARSLRTALGTPSFRGMQPQALRIAEKYLYYF